MSNKQRFVFLNEVKPYKDNWRVHVKVLHSRKSNTKFGESLECILTDQQGGKLHSTAKRNQMYCAQRNLPIGEWRFIEKFTVSAAGGQYRTSRSQYKMTITGETVFSKSDFSDDNPFLSLASYSILQDPKLKTVFLIDIIGEVFELGRIQTVQVHDKDRKRLQFRMRDTNGLDVAGCLWGKYAEQFEEYIERGNDQMLICLIRFAKINIFRDCYKMNFLLLFMRKNDMKMIKKQEADWNEIEVRSISEILAAYEPGSCKIICSIESIDTDWSLFYFGCNIHNTRAIKIGRSNPGTGKPLFRCEACHANVTNVSPK